MYGKNNFLEKAFWHSISCIDLIMLIDIIIEITKRTGHNNVLRFQRQP